MIRTDLALEAKEMYHESAGSVTEIEGVKARTEEKDGLTVTTVEILNEHGKQALGKEIGTYITIELPKFKEYGHAFFTVGSLELKERLLSLLQCEPTDDILVVGLGNRSITPDALGARVTDRLVITKHLKRIAPEAVKDLGSVSGITPGVMGITGMETAEIVKGIISRAHPKAVILIDSLASRSMDRISTTIQLSNTGISPGSGIGNTRDALDEHTLGVPVVSIGVPMVVDAATLAFDAVTRIENSPFAANDETFSKIKHSLSQNIGNLIVTPKDIDKLVTQMVNIVSAGINTALHGIPLDEIEQYIG